MANTVFDLPIYEEFFRTVREANRSLPAGQRLRVLLGDPPIDWATISNSEQILELMYARNAFAADLVRKEVLAKHRRALLLYADGHLLRKGEETVPDWMVVKRKPEEPLVSRLEKTHPGQVFNIGAPTNADLTTFSPRWRIGTPPRSRSSRAPCSVRHRSEACTGLSGPEFLNVRMQEQFDALLYLGSPSSITFSELSKSRCTDERYIKMRTARMALVPWGQYEIRALNAFCGRQ